jgi:hypothetical protein
MLHEAALGIAEAYFTNDGVVPNFQQIGEAYEKE